MEAFEIDPDENPMITAIRKLNEDEKFIARKMAYLKRLWPEVMAAAPDDSKPWDEMDSNLLRSLAIKIISNNPRDWV